MNGDAVTAIPVEKVQVGDHLLVKPGDVVPVDGTILSGQSSLDEASLTGESRPVDKVVGDTLMSGSVNGDGSLEMVADQRAEDSQYQTSFG